MPVKGKDLENQVERSARRAVPCEGTGNAHAALEGKPCTYPKVYFPDRYS